MKKENLKTKKSNKIQNTKQKNKRKEVELSDEKLKKVNGGGVNLLDEGLICPSSGVEFVEDKKRYYICPKCGTEFEENDDVEDDVVLGSSNAIIGIKSRTRKIKEKAVTAIRKGRVRVIVKK